MGFFDDLESEVSRPTGDDLERPVRLGDYDAVFARLKEGWVHTLFRMMPGQDKSKPQQFQEVEVAWDPTRGKYTWASRLGETAGRKRGRTLDDNQRFFDEQGLLDAFEEAPWVGHAALEAVGVDRSRPEF
jgi:hypothetical protein